MQLTSIKLLCSAPTRKKLVVPQTVEQILSHFFSKGNSNIVLHVFIFFWILMYKKFVQWANYQPTMILY
jgi:hypothetical protein